MKAVVLVGGEGTRLRPLTYTVPKQMLPVAGRTVIERVLGALAQHGVDHAVLSLGYRPDAFLRAYPDGCCGDVKLSYAVEGAPLDTAGAIAFAAGEAGFDDSTIVVMNGDVLTDFDIGALVDFHRKSGAEGTVALTPVEDPSRFGVVPVDESGKVQAFIEKPPAGTAPTNMINAGIYILEPSVLSRVEPGRRVSVEREVFPAMVSDGSLYALGSDAPWLDMGTVEKYVEASLNLAALEGSLATPELFPQARLTNTIVEGAADVGEGAIIDGCLLLNGCRVGPAAHVNDSIVGPGASVGAGAVVRNFSVLGDGWEVPPGEVLDGDRLPKLTVPS